jgi:hypothetical protein
MPRTATAPTSFKKYRSGTMSGAVIGIELPAIDEGVEHNGPGGEKHKGDSEKYRHHELHFPSDRKPALENVRPGVSG